MKTARLQQALRDPMVWLDDEAAARARYVLCRHVLAQIGTAACVCREPVLAVKGAALAHTVYPKPWLREMSDIDLVVHRGDRVAFVAALEQAGCQRVPAPPGRRFSAPLLDETALVYLAGSVSWTIEVHAGLDKVVSRSVPYDRIRARSVAVEELGALQSPCHEDHALLVALHASASVTDHPVAMIDLELLLRTGLDQALLVERAKRWQLRSALYLCLAQLHALGSHGVRHATIQALRPGRVRARLLRLAGRVDDHGAVPTGVREPGPETGSGLLWVLRQTPLRDDSLRWLGGISRYAAVRLADVAVGRINRLVRQRSGTE